MWAITLRQPGSMNTVPSPFHRSRPPSQQVRPTSPIRSRGLLPPLGQRGPGSGLRALGARAHLILAVASLPGLYGIVRGITLWPDLPTVPRSRAWIGWTRAGLTVAFVAVCLDE